MKEKKPILITCFPRISKVLAGELESLGYEVLEQEAKNVRTRGNWEDVMRLNLSLRTANRVLWEIDSFTVSKPDELYDCVKQIKWHLLIPKDGYFSVQSFVKNDYIKDTRFANLKVKDAIVDYHYELLGKRPDSGPDYSRTVIFLHWINDKATIYFDTSGESIAKHGYRKDPWKAPMSEALAAATILQSGWDPAQTDQHFVNPMCGSGTLAIEAAMMAANMPGNWNRSNFGFMHIVGFNRMLWNNIRREARKHLRKPPMRIVATDISPKAVQIAQRNALEAGVADYIDFETCDFRDTEVPEGSGVVFLNPEYGERLGEEKRLESTYKAIGDFFKQKCQGYLGYIFTGNLKLARMVGLKPKRKVEFLNAKIDSRLVAYELYKGKK